MERERGLEVEYGFRNSETKFGNPYAPVAALLEWPAFVNRTAKPLAAGAEWPLNSPDPALLAAGFVTGLQRKQAWA